MNMRQHVARIWPVSVPQTQSLLFLPLHPCHSNVAVQDERLRCNVKLVVMCGNSQRVLSAPSANASSRSEQEEKDRHHLTSLKQVVWYVCCEGLVNNVHVVFCCVCVVFCVLLRVLFVVVACCCVVVVVVVVACCCVLLRVVCCERPQVENDTGVKLRGAAFVASLVKVLGCVFAPQQ